MEEGGILGQDITWNTCCYEVSSWLVETGLNGGPKEGVVVG